MFFFLYQDWLSYLIPKKKDWLFILISTLDHFVCTYCKIFYEVRIMCCYWIFFFFWWPHNEVRRNHIGFVARNRDRSRPRQFVKSIEMHCGVLSFSVVKFWSPWSRSKSIYISLDKVQERASLSLCRILQWNRRKALGICVEEEQPREHIGSISWHLARHVSSHAVSKPCVSTGAEVTNSCIWLRRNANTWGLINVMTNEVAEKFPNTWLNNPIFFFI